MSAQQVCYLQPRHRSKLVGNDSPNIQQCLISMDAANCLFDTHKHAETQRCTVTFSLDGCRADSVANLWPQKARLCCYFTFYPPLTRIQWEINCQEADAASNSNTSASTGVTWPKTWMVAGHLVDIQDDTDAFPQSATQVLSHTYGLPPRRLGCAM